jgi:hypothetical protein
MKTVGIMCCRDEGDLLPQVYPHIRERVDYLYAYDDGSIDGTWEFLKYADYAIRKEDDTNRPGIARPNYHHLLEKIKADFKGEEVWCFITMGDRFFLNKEPRQIVEEAGDHTAVNGVQLDFLRHRIDPWTEENDPWPDLGNIRNLCRWFRFDEQCCVAFRLDDRLSYLEAKYPWPRGMQYGSIQYSLGEKISVDMPYFEHQGRRTPKARIWREESGSRPKSEKYSHYDNESFAGVLETQKRMYLPYRVLPWVGLESLDKVVELHNEDCWQNAANLRYFFLGLEYAYQRGWVPPTRDDPE